MSRVSISGSCAIILLLCLSADVAADTIVISEIMFNPDGDENAREYVELVNITDESVALTGYVIGDGEGFDGIVPVTVGIDVIQPGGYGLILDPDYFEGADPYEIPGDVTLFTVSDRAIGSRGLSNSTAETVSLITAFGDTISQVTYDISCPAGHSWERILPDGGDDISNYRPSVIADGTPGSVNSVLPPLHDAALDSLSMIIAPSSPQYGESLTVTLTCNNVGREPISGITVAVYMVTSSDIQQEHPISTVTFTETIPPHGISGEKTTIIDQMPGGLVTLTAVITSDIIPSANDTLSIACAVPVPAGTVILSEVMAAPLSGAAEWIEVLNTGNVPVSLTDWRIGDTSGSYSNPVRPDHFLGAESYALIGGISDIPGIPGETLIVSTESLPSLNNDGDTVKLIDWTSTVVDSMQYTDCDTGISWELISPEQAGSETGWDMCVDDGGATPGRRNSIAYPPLAVENGESVHLDLTIEPNPFENRTSIAYQLPFPLARVRLRVYDRRGRQVATLRDTHESGSEWSGEWDGQDDSGSQLPAGPYILHLEVLDKQDGKVHTVHKMVVIGSHL